MKTMEAQLFKKNCLVVIDEVEAKHKALLITKGGKPVAKLVPMIAEADDIFGFLEGKGKIVGDIFSAGLRFSGDESHLRRTKPGKRQRP
jgi:antitoxin (DNA-binding transcriptional repressor) of toxin-antitoxin stability system